MRPSTFKAIRLSVESIRSELRSLQETLQECRSAIANQVVAQDKAEQDEQEKISHSIDRFTNQKDQADNTAEANQQHRHRQNLTVQRVLTLGTWLAFVAAAVYAGFAYRTMLEAEKQTTAAQCTARAAQEQAELMRQQLEGTMAADIDLTNFTLSDAFKLRLTATNSGQVAAQDVHISVDASQRRIDDDSIIGPIFHFEPSVPKTIKGGRGDGWNWDLPWRLTDYERDQGNSFASDWPGKRTFEIRATATFKDGFEDKTITRSVCKRWLPSYMITWKIDPNTAGGGAAFDCSDFRNQIKLILGQEKAAKNGDRSAQ
jgi:hypothetical protein